MSSIEVSEQASRKLVEFQFSFECGELLGRLSILTSEHKRRVRNLTASSVLLSTSVKMTNVVKEEFTRRRRTTFLDEPRSFLLLRAIMEKSKYQALYLEKRNAMLEKVLVKYAETVIWDGILGPQEQKARRQLEEVDEVEDRQMLLATMQYQGRYVDTNHMCTLESHARTDILLQEINETKSITKQFNDGQTTILLEAASDAISTLLDLEIRHREGIVNAEATVDITTNVSAEWLIESYIDAVSTDIIRPHYHHLFAAPTSSSGNKPPSQQQLQSLHVLPTKFFTRHLQYQVPMLINKEERERVFMMAMEENSWNNNLIEKYHVPVITSWRRMVACRRIQACIRGENARKVLRLAHQSRTREQQRLRNANLHKHVVMAQRFAQATLSMKTASKLFVHTHSTTLQQFTRTTISQKLCVTINESRRVASMRIHKTVNGFISRKQCGNDLTQRTRMANLREAKASQLQRWAKSQITTNKARAATRAIVRRRHTAATTIQSLWKGVRAQRGFQGDGGLKSLLLERKVCKLQRVLRGAVVRQMVFFPILRARFIQRFAWATLSQRFVAVRRAIRPYVTLIHAVCLSYATRRYMSVLKANHVIKMKEDGRNRAGETVTGFMKSAHRKMVNRRAFDAKMVLLQEAVYLGPVVPIDTINTALRGYKERKLLGVYLHKQHNHAALIQQFCRSVMSSQMVHKRADLHRMQCHVECISTFVSSWNAAHHTIPSQHQYMVQKLTSIKASSSVFFRVCGSYRQRKACGVQYNSQVHGVLHIQSAFRQYSARKELNSRKDVQRRLKHAQQELRSVCRLQKWWRIDICRKRYVAAATIQLFFHRCHPTITLRQEEREAKQGLWRFQRLQLERLATVGDDRVFIRTEEDEERSVLRDMYTSETLPQQQHLRSATKPASSSTQMPTQVVQAQLAKIERKEEFKRLLIEKEYLHERRHGDNSGSNNSSSIAEMYNNSSNNSSSIAEMYNNTFLPSLVGLYTGLHRSERDASIKRADTIRSRLEKEERNTRRNLFVYHYRRCDYLFKNIEAVDMTRKVDKCRDDVERSEMNERKEMEDILMESIARCVDNQLLDDGEGSVFARTLLQSSNPHVRLLSKDRQWTYENIVARRNQQKQQSLFQDGIDTSIRHDDSPPQMQLSSSFKKRVSSVHHTTTNAGVSSSKSKRAAAGLLSTNPFLGLALPVVLPPQFTDSRAAALMVGSGGHHASQQQPFSRSAPIITDVAPSTTDRLNALHETRLTLRPSDNDDVNTASKLAPFPSLTIESTHGDIATVSDDTSIGDDVVGNSSGGYVLRVVFPSPLWMSGQEQQALVNQASSSSSSQIPFDSYRTRVETCVASALQSITAFASTKYNNDNNNDSSGEGLSASGSGVSLFLDVDQDGEFGSLIPLHTCLSTTTTTSSPTDHHQLAQDVIIRRLGLLEENVANLLRNLDTTRLDSHRLMVSGWRPRSETPPLLALIRSITVLDMSPLSSGLWKSIHSEPSLATSLDTTSTKVAARALRGILSQMNFLFGKGLTTLEIYFKELALSVAGSHKNSDDGDIENNGEAPTSSSGNAATLASYKRVLPPLETARAWLSQSRKRKQLMDDVAASTHTQKKKTLPAPSSSSLPVKIAAPVRPTFDPQQSLFLPNVSRVVVMLGINDNDGEDKDDPLREGCDALHILAMIKGLEMMLTQQSTFRCQPQQKQVAPKKKEDITAALLLPGVEEGEVQDQEEIAGNNNNIRQGTAKVVLPPIAPRHHHNNY